MALTHKRPIRKCEKDSDHSEIKAANAELSADVREILKVGADLRLVVSTVTDEVTGTECLGRTMGRLPTANNLQSYIPQNVSQCAAVARQQRAGRSLSRSGPGRHQHQSRVESSRLF